MGSTPSSSALHYNPIQKRCYCSTACRILHEKKASWPCRVRDTKNGRPFSSTYSFPSAAESCGEGSFYWWIAACTNFKSLDYKLNLERSGFGSSALQLPSTCTFSCGGEKREAARYFFVTVNDVHCFQRVCRRIL